VKRGGGGRGFKVELERATELRRGRPLCLSMAWEEVGAAAMARQRARGDARPTRRSRKGGRGKGACGLVGRIGLLGQMAAEPEEIKKENRNLFQN
jgi:hypothetical protein